MKKIFSYFVPIKVKSYSSPISGELEVTYLNGRKVLDAEKANYSYGSLQRVLHMGLQHIEFSKERKSVLVLGMGGGSVVESIRRDFNSEAEITLVEIDPVMIRIAREEFDLEQYGKINIIQADAADYVKTSIGKFEVLIVDLFIQDQIPQVFTEEAFLIRLPQLMAPNGKLIFNTMRGSLRPETREFILEVLHDQGLEMRTLERIMTYNDLLIGSKVPANQPPLKRL